MIKILKFSLYFLLPFLFLSESSIAQYSGTGSNPNSEYVEGYYRDDGTHVEGYYRTKKNSYNLDNYSAEGNYNPYTGEKGNKEYDSPYNSLGNKSKNIDMDYEINTEYKSNYNSDTKIDVDSNYDTDYNFEY